MALCKIKTDEFFDGSEFYDWTVRAGKGVYKVSHMGIEDVCHVSSLSDGYYFSSVNGLIEGDMWGANIYVKKNQLRGFKFSKITKISFLDS